MFSFNPIYLWLAVIILGVTVEAFSLSLTSIWFAVGALGALVAASFGLSIGVQVGIFVIFSALLLVLLRPFFRRFLKTETEPTNADRILGQTAVVIEDIDNAKETGSVKLIGQIWTARSVSGQGIAAGTEVRVREICGVKAMVEPLSPQR